MIITKLYGGLGNQMFQYATGQSLALRNDDTLKLDLLWFGNTGRHIGRSFKLGGFNTEIIEASIEEISKFAPSRWRKALGMYNHKRYIKEKSFNFDKNIVVLDGSVYLDGYWQSEKYFKEFENKIKSTFTPGVPMSNEALKVERLIHSTQNPISLHIRRGDYVQNSKTNAYHGTCSMDYYKSAIDYIQNKVGGDKVFVFSDDTEWAMGQDLFRDAVFVSGLGIKDYEEMILMSMCKHNIVANSSFSWWGAWLNRNSDKIIVSPRKWFSVKKDTSDLIPESWIKI